jgi:acetyl-CoA carboxylase carboxyl transferase subunit beta
MGLFSREKPKIKVQTTKKDGFSGWIKCTQCNELIHANELKQNTNCCPKCDYHYRLDAMERIESLSDEGTFVELYAHLKASDPLHFVDSAPYAQRLQKAVAATGRNDAIITGHCTLGNHPVALGVMDFNFMGGSMGSVVGEKLTLLIEQAIDERRSVIIVSTSGGARMQESIFSLMQMAKTSSALAKLSEAGLPFISILTNPTTGGVTASFASLGDIILAEPGALICFAGPRVIEQTIGQKLPEGAQKSEFLVEHGMVDCIVHRKDLKTKLSQILDLVG